MADDLTDLAVSAKPAESIEADLEVKEEDDMVDAPGEDDGEDVGPSSGRVTHEQSKALKAVCDAITNHRVTRRGDE